MTGRASYLFKRPGSQNWYLRLQYTGELAKSRKSKSISLGTSDIKEANVKALPLIAEHKSALLEYARSKMPFRVRIVYVSSKFKPGDVHDLEDGRRVFASKDHLNVLNLSGETIDRISNLQFDPPKDLTVINHRHLRAVEYADKVKQSTTRKDPDDRLIDIWIKQKNVSKHIEREAKLVWSEFRELTKSKPLKKCNRDDARSLVEHLEAKGNGPSTIQKKISHLRSAVNIAIDDGKLAHNPFRKVVPKVRLIKRRLGLTDDDMTKVRMNMHLLSEDDQLLWKILATTGMRRGEAFHINEEFEENGVRFVKVGTKTESSFRKIPIPSCIEADVPSRIKAQLIKGSPDAAGKRLTRFLQQLGIAYDPKAQTGDRRKVLHSLRHRAASKLDASGCDNKIKKVLMGHSTNEVSDIYGQGYPVGLLKSHIDFVGY